MSESTRLRHGLAVAVLGPDGSGKSSLIAGLSAKLAPLGRDYLSFHLIPSVAISGHGPATDPHDCPPRGVFLSLLKLLYLVAVYDFGWMVRVWPARTREKIVYFDRYYHDILADPVRYRNGAPDWVVRLLSKCIPVPDIFLILDVPPEVVRARKTEVSAGESDRQFRAYRDLAPTLPNACLIDANASLAEVVVRCEREIVRRMADRGRRASYAAT